MNLVNMGFKKIYLNREKIINVYNQGLPKLISLIENNECLIFEDDFSKKL